MSQEVKLTPPQVRFLRHAGQTPTGAPSISHYPPARALCTLGLVEETAGKWGHSRWTLTEAGRHLYARLDLTHVTTVIVCNVCDEYVASRPDGRCDKCFNKGRIRRAPEARVRPVGRPVEVLLDDMFELLARSVAYVDDIPVSQLCHVCQGVLNPQSMPPGPRHTPTCAFALLKVRYDEHVRKRGQR